MYVYRPQYPEIPLSIIGCVLIIVNAPNEYSQGVRGGCWENCDRINVSSGIRRGATCFAWDEARAMLAVGLKKRLMLFHYDGTDFVELKEVALAEAPLAASWAGNYICLACKATCEAMLQHPSQYLITTESILMFTFTIMSRPPMSWPEFAPWLLSSA